MCEANLRARGQTPPQNGPGHAYSSGGEYSVISGFGNDHGNLRMEKTPSELEASIPVSHSSPMTNFSLPQHDFY